MILNSAMFVLYVTLITTEVGQPKLLGKFPDLTECAVAAGYVARDAVHDGYVVRTAEVAGDHVLISASNEETQTTAMIICEFGEEA